MNNMMNPYMPNNNLYNQMYQFNKLNELEQRISNIEKEIHRIKKNINYKDKNPKPLTSSPNIDYTDTSGMYMV